MVDDVRRQGSKEVATPDVPDDDFALATRRAAETRLRHEIADFGNEAAGRETGRLSRYGLADREDAPRGREKDRKARAFRDLLEALLSDPAYRERYERVVERLQSAERATEDALADVAKELAEAERDLDDIQKRAARLPTGARVYRDAHGVVRHEDGSVVDDVLAATIIWRGDEPSYEEMTSAQARLQQLHALLEALRLYQADVLGPARDRLEDRDEPPTLEELDTILLAIEETMPSHSEASPDPVEPARRDAALTASIEVPSL